VRRHAAGFTLIEVLVATVLLAAGLALAFVTVRSAMTISQRGEVMATDSERMRAVQGLLRRQLGAALRSPLQPLDPGQEPQYFVGDEQGMRFVADLPGYLGRGGPYLHDLQVAKGADGLRLELGLVMVQDGQLFPEQPPRRPELLVGQLREVTMRYRGLDPATGQWTDWLPRWDDTRRLPVLVSIRVVPERGQAWPELQVALERAGQAGGR